MQNRKLLTKGLCVLMTSCMLMTSTLTAMAVEGDGNSEIVNETVVEEEVVEEAEEPKVPEVEETYESVLEEYNNTYTETQKENAQDYLDNVNNLKEQISNPEEGTDVDALNSKLLETVIRFEVLGADNDTVLTAAENKDGKYESNGYTWDKPFFVYDDGTSVKIYTYSETSGGDITVAEITKELSKDTVKYNGKDCDLISPATEDDKYTINTGNETTKEVVVDDDAYYVVESDDSFSVNTKTVDKILTSAKIDNVVAGKTEGGPGHDNSAETKAAIVKELTGKEVEKNKANEEIKKIEFQFELDGDKNVAKVKGVDNATAYTVNEKVKTDRDGNVEIEYYYITVAGQEIKLKDVKSEHATNTIATTSIHVEKGNENEKAAIRTLLTGSADGLNNTDDKNCIPVALEYVDGVIKYATVLDYDGAQRYEVKTKTDREGKTEYYITVEVQVPQYGKGPDKNKITGYETVTQDIKVHTDDGHAKYDPISFTTLTVNGYAYTISTNEDGNTVAVPKNSNAPAIKVTKNNDGTYNVLTAVERDTQYLNKANNTKWGSDTYSNLKNKLDRLNTKPDENDRLPQPNPVVPGTPDVIPQGEIDPYAGYIPVTDNVAVAPVVNAVARNVAAIQGAGAAPAAIEAEGEEITIAEGAVPLSGGQEIEEKSTGDITSIAEDIVPLGVEKNNTVFFGILGLLIALLVAAYLYIKNSRKQAE